MDFWNRLSGLHFIGRAIRPLPSGTAFWIFPSVGRDIRPWPSGNVICQSDWVFSLVGSSCLELLCASPTGSSFWPGYYALHFCGPVRLVLLFGRAITPRIFVHQSDWFFSLAELLCLEFLCTSPTGSSLWSGYHASNFCAPVRLGLHFTGRAVRPWTPPR